MKNICRICLDSSGESQYIPIFSGNTSPTIDEKILIISGIRIIKNDGLPEAICSDCSNTLDNFIDFKTQIVKSDEYFRNKFANACEQTLDEEIDVETVEEENDNPVTIDVCTKNISSDLNTLATAENDIQLVIENSSESDCEVITDSSIINETCRLRIRPNNVNTDIKLPASSKHKRDGLSSETARTIACAVCDKLIVRKRIKDHMESHNSVNKYFCDLCGKGFKRRGALVLHKKRHMKGGHLHVTCNICNKTFLTGRDLKTHEGDGSCQKGEMSENSIQNYNY